MIFLQPPSTPPLQPPFLFHRPLSILYSSSPPKPQTLSLAARSSPNTSPTNDQDILRAVEKYDGETPDFVPAVRSYENDLSRLSVVGPVDFRQALTAAAADGGEAAEDHISSGVSTMVIETLFPGSPDERSTIATRLIHSKRRNRLEHKRLNDLVYVRYNQILHHRYKKRDSIDPISLKDIDDSNEWLTGQMESLDLDEGGDGTGAPDLVFPGEDLDWAMVSEAAGVDEPQARTRAKGKAPASTSNVYQRRGRARQALVEEEEEEDVDEDEDEDEDEEEEFVCDDNDSDDYPEEDATYDNDSP